MREPVVVLIRVNELVSHISHIITIAAGRLLYPDKTTGFASSSAATDISYAHNNLGDIVTQVDQNGTTHAFSYDPLYRLTLDAVNTLGSGVDGSVRAIGYSYNTQDLPFKQTSCSDAAATTVVNEVEDVYNGLGQLTQQYQEHSGAVNTSTSLSTQYAYSTIPAGSRHRRRVFCMTRVSYITIDCGDG